MLLTYNGVSSDAVTRPNVFVVECTQVAFIGLLQRYDAAGPAFIPDTCVVMAAKDVHSFIRVPEGIFYQAKDTQGDGGLRVDVPSEEVCQHWGLAGR